MISKRQIGADEAADIIERFLSGSSLYPQEWNDFVDSKSGEPSVESYRKRCDELDPLVNSPKQDENALAELRDIVVALRKLSADAPHVEGAVDVR